jgi:hypothetical protein
MSNVRRHNNTVPNTTKSDVVGLVRFFPSRERLKAFVAGDLYLNTPHFYRRLEQAGLGDDFDACVAFYSPLKHPRPPRIVLDGVEKDLTKVTELLIYLDDDRFDGHLQCWFVVAKPESDEDLSTLKSDLSQVQREFGMHYVLLPIENLIQYLRVVWRAAKSPLRAEAITYSDDRFKGSMFVKRASYGYQREYRVALGKTDKGSTEPRKIATGSLSHLVHPNPFLKITIGTEEHLLLVPHWHAAPPL